MEEDKKDNPARPAPVRLAFRVSYLGSRFFGSQMQAQSRTVEGEFIATCQRLSLSGTVCSCFLAVILFVEGVYVWWNDSRGPEARRIESRLRVMSAGMHGGDDKRVSIVKERLLAESPRLQKLLLRAPRVHQLDRLLEQSGLPWSVALFLALTLACAAVGGGAATLLRWPSPFVVLVAVGAALPPCAYVTRSKRKRLQKIDVQLPDALDLMGRALRAGHASPSAVQMVRDEMAQPIAASWDRPRRGRSRYRDPAMR